MKILITGGSGFIGTNLIEYLAKYKYSMFNIDKASPINKNHNSYWYDCNILDKKKLKSIFAELQPVYVIHLAARADVEGKVLDDYKDNIEGTANVLEAVKSVSSVKRLIVTSTQFVNQYQGLPKNDEDYAPHTVYGESKIITEELTRKADLECCWTIIRPTNIWGPWHRRYPHEIWKIIAERKYIHPNKKNVIRSYGYVGNVVWQIFEILKSDSLNINKKVLYVGDKPIYIFDWVNGFSEKQIGRTVIVVPSLFLMCVAFVGDILKIFKIKFPITSTRYKSMTTSNAAPMELAFNALGKPPYTLEQGIAETVDWLKHHYPKLVKI